jgi:hypothetical protein
MQTLMPSAGTVEQENDSAAPGNENARQATGTNCYHYGLYRRRPVCFAPPPFSMSEPSSNYSIEYDLSRRDLVTSYVSIFLRNRTILVFVIAALLFNLVLYCREPGFSELSLAEKITSVAIRIFCFVAIILFLQLALGLAVVFSAKNRGLVGRHVLEITNEGLIERTEFNQSLNRWTGMRKILSSPYYLYIYVSDSNFHMVPKRCFDPLIIQQFEEQLRLRMTLSTQPPPVPS